MLAAARSVMTYACPACEFAADTYLIKLQFSMAHTGSRNAHGFSFAVRV
jgi:hypothetical protein